MPELNKVLLAHALALGFDGTTEIEVIFRKPGEKMAVIFDGVKSKNGTAAESPMSERIMEIIGSLDDGESMIGKEIATEAGYTYGGTIRRCIAQLVEQGKIQKFPSGGYGRLLS